MLQRQVRAAARGDDWGCCPAKPVRLLQRENVTSVHNKPSQAAADDARYSTRTVRVASWGDEVRGGAPNGSGTDPVTAAAGLSAGGSSASTCRGLVYVAVTSSVVVAAALVIALVAILVRRRRLHSSARGSNGGRQWNSKKLAGILTAPAHRDLLRQQAKSAAPKPGLQDAGSATPSASASSKRPSSAGGNPRHGYTLLPGSVYPSSKVSTATQRRDPNPYGLPPSQCSYQPQRVKFVTLKRKRTFDSQTGDIDAADNDEELSPSHQYTEVDAETPSVNDLQALLPLSSLRSLFGVVSGVFGVVPSSGGGRQPVAVVDRRASCVAGANSSTASPATHLIDRLINGTKSALPGRDANAATQSVDVARDMGANASAEPHLSGMEIWLLVPSPKGDRSWP